MSKKTKKNNCSPIIHVLDNKIDEGVIYDGFYISNYDYVGSNVYRSVTVEECQYLCEISDQCRYFIYDLKSLMSGGPFENKCHLKFGVGRRIELEGGAFGHKYSSGNEKYICTNIAYIVLLFQQTALSENGQPGENVNHQMVLVAVEQDSDIKKNCFQAEMVVTA